MKKFLTCLVLFIVGLNTTFASEQEEEQRTSHREDKNFYLTAALSGQAFFSHRAGAFAGIQASYQLSESLQITASLSRFNRDPDSDKENDYGEEKMLGQKAGEIDSHDIEDTASIEVRYFPFWHGFYLSAGAARQGKEEIELSFRNRSREVGDNTYTTGLTAELEYERRIIPTFGAGYQHTFKNGLILGFGAKLGLTESQNPDVVVASTNGSVSQADLDYWKEQIIDHEKRYFFEGFGSIGFAF